MNDHEHWIRQAELKGFTRAGWLDTRALSFEHAQTFRGYCAQNTCGSYSACWTCPPGVGPVKHCVDRISSFGQALLVQHEENADVSNPAAVGRIRGRFKALLAGFAPEVRDSFPGALPLGSGGCEICPECAYPQAPCRYPGEMIQSVSAFCIDAQQACDLAGLPCWREGFVTFTGMFFIE